MIRFRILIKKEDLFDLTFREDISKIEMANSYNKTLKDKTLCSVYVYLKLKPNRFQDIFNMTEICKNISKELLQKNLDNKDIGFLTGITSWVLDRFISVRHIYKIVELDSKYKEYNFNIPKWLKRVIPNLNSTNFYDYLKNGELRKEKLI